MSKSTKKPEVKSRTEVEKEAAKTAATNTAIEAAKNTDKKNPDRSESETVLYVSAAPEDIKFSIRANGSKYDAIKTEDGKHICFRVKKADVALFEKHEFVAGGRIVRASK